MRWILKQGVPRSYAKWLVLIRVGWSRFTNVIAQKFKTEFEY